MLDETVKILCLPVESIVAIELDVDAGVVDEEYDQGLEVNDGAIITGAPINAYIETAGIGVRHRRRALIDECGQEGRKFAE